MKRAFKFGGKLAGKSASKVQIGSNLNQSVYISSLNGNDSNDGLSEDTAVATFAKAVTLGLKSYKLEKGSLFREQFTITEEKTTIDVFGSGNQPIINARDVITGSWTKTIGKTNVYEKSVTVESGSIDSSIYPRCFENEAPLIEQTTVDLVDTNEGSCYFSGTYPNYTLYVHASTGDDPTSNGKEYEATKRLSCIYTNSEIDNCAVKDITTISNAHIDGSLVLRGRNCLISNCNAMHGSKHNMFIGSGIVNGGSAKYASYSNSLGLFVCYVNTPVGTEKLNVSSFTSELSEFTVFGSAYLMHNSGGSNFLSATTTDCVAKNCGTAYNFGDTDTIIHNNLTADDCITCIGGLQDNSIEIYGGLVKNENTASSSIFFEMKNGCSIKVRDNFTIQPKTTNGALFYSGAAAVKTGITVDIDGMIVDPVYRTGFVWGFTISFNDGSSGNSITVKNTYWNGANGVYRNIYPDRVTFVSDYNTYQADTGLEFKFEGLSYYTLSSYQTATGLDSNSIIGSIPS